MYLCREACAVLSKIYKSSYVFTCSVPQVYKFLLYVQNKALVIDCYWPVFTARLITCITSSRFVMYKTVGNIREHTCQQHFSLQPLFIWLCFKHQGHKPLPCKSSIFSLSSLLLIFSTWQEAPLQNSFELNIFFTLFCLTVSVHSTLLHAHIFFCDLKVLSATQSISIWWHGETQSVCVWRPWNETQQLT